MWIPPLRPPFFAAQCSRPRGSGDPSATIDSALGDFDGFQNEGDNEVTGIHVSDGNPTIAGLLGVKVPHAFSPGSPWRVFVTAQHGDNVTYELTRR